MRGSQKGFTLIELMIVVAIIIILAAIALPQYQHYVNKAKFTEVIAAAAPHKISVELCSMEVGIEEIKECKSGQNGIAAVFTKNEKEDIGHVGAIEVLDGKIIVTADKNFGHKEKPTYELIPKFTSTTMAWRIGGTCKEAKLC